MKERIRTITAALLILIMVFSFSACGKSDFTKIDTGILSDDKSNTELISASGTDALIAFGKAGKSGVIKTTRGFMLYDSDKEAVSLVAPISASVRIRRALALEDSIIYVNYKKNDDGTVNWNVIELSEGSCTYILSGTCKGISELPGLFTLEDEPYVVWKDRTSDVAGMSRINGGSIERLVTVDSGELINTSAASNGKYALLYMKSEGQRVAALADKSGVIMNIPMDGKLKGFALTKNNALIATTKGDSKESFLLIDHNIKKEESETLELSIDIKAMSSGDDDTALCSDSENRMYKISGSDGKIKEIEAPEGTEGASVKFGDITEGKAIVALSKDGNTVYYVLEAK